MTDKKMYALAGIFGLVLLILGGIWLVFLADFTDYAAKVNGYGITRTTLDAGVEKRMIFYHQANQDIDRSVLEKDILDQMIDRQLIETYALENDVVVTDEELQQRYMDSVNSADSEEALLADIQQMWGLDKDEYLANIRFDILRESVQEHTGQPLAEWLEAERASSKIIIKL